VNAFPFPQGMMTTNLLDVDVILNLPITGFGAPSAHTFEFDDLGIVFIKKRLCLFFLHCNKLDYSQRSL